MSAHTFKALSMDEPLPPNTGGNRASAHDWEDVDRRASRTAMARGS
jgi:hypothetical protein